MRKLLGSGLFISLLLLQPGCFTSFGFCCGRLTDGDELTRGDRKDVKKEIRKDDENEREDKRQDFAGDAAKLRDKDYAAYLRFVADKLDLPAVWTANRAQPGFTRALRVQAFDGLAGPDGVLATARLEDVPDYAAIVHAAAEKAFGDEASSRVDARVSRDLWLADRWSARHFDLGIAGVELLFHVATPGGDVVIGRARTDPSGRATLSLPPGALPEGVGVGPSALTVGIAGTPPRPLAVEPEPAAQLFVRGPGTPGKIVVVEADAVLEWLGRAALTDTLVEKIYRPRDYCVPGALANLAKQGVRVVIVSSQPDRLAPAFRDGLVKAGIVPATTRVPLAFSPSDFPVEKEEAIAFLAATLEVQKGWWGAANVAGLIGTDAAIDGEAAKRAGVPFLPLSAPSRGGWCAGIPPVVAATTP